MARSVDNRRWSVAEPADSHPSALEGLNFPPHSALAGLAHLLFLPPVPLRSADGYSRCAPAGLGQRKGKPLYRLRYGEFLRELSEGVSDTPAVRGVQFSGGVHRLSYGENDGLRAVILPLAAVSPPRLFQTAALDS